MRLKEFEYSFLARDVPTLQTAWSSTELGSLLSSEGMRFHNKRALLVSNLIKWARMKIAYSFPFKGLSSSVSLKRSTVALATSIAFEREFPSDKVASSYASDSKVYFYY